MVPKYNKECIDMNKAIPKNPFPLPLIDQVVDLVASHDFFCFFDVYKGYHHIPMVPEDMEKTIFATDDGIFCYTRMPFRLKKTQAEFQQMVNKIFRDNLEKHGGIC